MCVVFCLYLAMGCWEEVCLVLGGFIQLLEQLLAEHPSLINREIASGENYSGIRPLNVFSLPHTKQTHRQRYIHTKNRGNLQVQKLTCTHGFVFFFSF